MQGHTYILQLGRICTIGRSDVVDRGRRAHCFQARSLQGRGSGRQLIGRVLPEQDDPVTIRVGECDIGAWGVIELKPAVDGDTFIL